MKLRQSLGASGLALLAMFNPARADDSAASINPPNTNAPVVAITNAMVNTNDMAVTVTNAAPVAPVIAAASAPAKKFVPAPTTPSYRPFTIGGELGTTGGGINGHWQFADHLGIGAAFDHLAATYNGKIEGNDYHTHLRLTSVPITLDGYPLNNNFFRVSGGVVINRNHFTGTSTGTVDLDGTPYTGTAQLSIKQQPVNPYVAVGGLFYFTKDHRFSLGGEMGLIFTGEPRVHLTLNPPNGAVETQRRHEESQIRHYARYAQVWPVLKFSLNYSF